MSLNEDMMQEKMRQCPDWNQYCCDGCDKILKNASFYHLLNSQESFDLCLDCYGMIESGLLVERDDTRLRFCNICFQYLTKPAWGIKENFDVCQKCLPNVKNAFILINNTDSNPSEAVSTTYIFTEMGYTYRCGKKRSNFPESITNRINNALYIDLLDNLVRPPVYDWDASEWTLISDLEEVPLFDASCCFAVSCHGKIASVVCDDHGRIAMNIVFDDVETFLKAETEWETLLPETAIQRAKALDEVKQAFDTSRSCDNALLKKATDSFAVYTRLDRNLAMYYG